jgi:hypothetical protein
VIDSEPFTFEMWEDAMIEKNDVRPRNKSSGNLHWPYKIKPTTDGCVEGNICDSGLSMTRSLPPSGSFVAIFVLDTSSDRC